MSNLWKIKLLNRFFYRIPVEIHYTRDRSEITYARIVKKEGVRYWELMKDGKQIAYNEEWKVFRKNGYKINVKPIGETYVHVELKKGPEEEHALLALPPPTLNQELGNQITTTIIRNKKRPEGFEKYILPISMSIMLALLIIGFVGFYFILDSQTKAVEAQTALMDTTYQAMQGVIQAYRMMNITAPPV